MLGFFKLLLAADAAQHFGAVAQAIKGDGVAASDAQTIVRLPQALQRFVDLAQGLQGLITAGQVDFAVGGVGMFTVGVLQQLLSRMFNAALRAQLCLQLMLKRLLSLQQGRFQQGVLAWR